MKKILFLWMLLLLLSATLILSACQGDGNTEAPDTTTSAIESLPSKTAAKTTTAAESTPNTTPARTTDTTTVATLASTTVLTSTSPLTSTVVQTPPTTVPSTSVPTTAPLLPTEEESMALAMVQTILDGYGFVYGKGENAALNMWENYGTKEQGYLWTNFCAVGMQYYVCKLYPDDEGQQEIYRKMLQNFKHFRQSNPADNAAPDSVKYHSARGMRVGGGQGDCFFDDNVWVARNYLRAYEILGDAWYLEEAIRVNNWVLSGWNETLGGLVWSEHGLSDNADAQHLERGLSANACAIIVNGQLAALAKNADERAFYLGWAEKFYDFCKQMQNTPTSYDYWNGIHTVIVNGERQNGEINRVHFAYNSGSMILADLVMYSLYDDQEKQDAFLQDAVKTAAAAKRTFYRFDPTTKQFYYQGDPWFAAILGEAYYELYLLDPTLGSDYMDTFSKNVKTAYENRDKASGLCPYQAIWQVTWDKNEIRGLHQIGFAEQAVLVALYRR